MDKRLNHLENELRDLDKRLESLRSGLYGEIRDLRRVLDYRFYRLLGVQISMWVTIILAIIFSKLGILHRWMSYLQHVTYNIW
jgi:hypothetical protein